VIAHNFVLNFDWLLSPQFALFGRYSYSIANIDPINPNVDGGTVNLQAFQLGAAFPDLGKEGALGTLAMVIPFDVVSGRRFLLAGSGDGGTQVDLAAVYSYPVTDEISLIPSFFVTLNPNNFNENPILYSATLRLQFLF
jgi:Carbohydrate-selective porin, OprB family